MMIDRLGKCYCLFSGWTFGHQGQKQQVRVKIITRVCETFSNENYTTRKITSNMFNIPIYGITCKLHRLKAQLHGSGSTRATKWYGSRDAHIWACARDEITYVYTYNGGSIRPWLHTIIIDPRCTVIISV